MSDYVKDLINNIADGNLESAEQDFNAAFSDKVSSALENIRVSVASKLTAVEEEYDSKKHHLYYVASTLKMKGDFVPHHDSHYVKVAKGPNEEDRVRKIVTDHVKKHGSNLEHGRGEVETHDINHVKKVLFNRKDKIERDRYRRIISEEVESLDEGAVGRFINSQALRLHPHRDIEVNVRSVIDDALVKKLGTKHPKYKELHDKYVMPKKGDLDMDTSVSKDEARKNAAKHYDNFISDLKHAKKSN